MGKDKLARKAWRQGLKVMYDLSLFQEMAACLGGNVNDDDETPSSTPAPTPTTLSPKPSEKFEIQQTETGSPIDQRTFEALANAAVGQIQHGVGDAKVDKVIGITTLYPCLLMLSAWILQ